MAETQTDLTSLTVDLLAAFVSHNSVRSEDLAGLIQSTHAALSGLSSASTPEPQSEEPAAEFTPAVSVRKSLASRDHIISMIDGKPYRALKRHLTSHGLSFADYKARYNLPDSYPSVAPGYSEARRETAKRLGLGRKKKESDAAPATVPSEPQAPAKPARTRRKAATLKDSSENVA